MPGPHNEPAVGVPADDVQAIAPTGLDVPDAQAVHVVKPVLAAKKLAGQELHATVPGAALKLPAGQAGHPVAPATGDELPAAQGLHVVEPGTA